MATDADSLRGDGWRFFAGTMLGLAGIMRFFDAIWAFTYNGPLPSNLEGSIFGHSLTTYGWVYLILAIILLGCSIGIIVLSQFSRWIGIIAAALLAVSAVSWMPYYPVWGFVYIVLAILVIYALAAYAGRDAAGV